ncbi:hypothetical protein K435DRAFT_743767 [Dendrothele bispora CBS 962.96]|uniref:Membrane protein BRI3 n=1 Tax=Dendrothele bispora (strain CBS 962.96) TaxID=1314807 RepID=A0A4S8MTQ9_DENBC|nr:hypothetical protein K435DRAFT_743767 [Dendrothele bispora CBS 962.96]
MDDQEKPQHQSAPPYQHPTYPPSPYHQPSHEQQTYQQPQTYQQTQPHVQPQPYPPQPYQQPLYPAPNQQPIYVVQNQPSNLEVGERYRSQLWAMCARGAHDPETRYGCGGIVIAIIFFPLGLIALAVDRQKKCARCGIRM